MAGVMPRVRSRTLDQICFIRRCTGCWQKRKTNSTTSNPRHRCSVKSGSRQSRFNQARPGLVTDTGFTTGAQQTYPLANLELVDVTGLDIGQQFSIIGFDGDFNRIFA